ncbi:dTDP-4-dehydrorhamnose 3,5-epimerase [Verrucomicrobia bacterium]|jgi:dTDP-4-dehydrorhamnose 3,5-epimerase|nr:dTDP-4-dehydrorhamnose 3,5-epimerase [Verrucomicrobiota bacterium]MDB4664808.1 dTDP-4-dehydrorhamnose 3,5-epimerase [Verrucomicrobiota bacterium]MDG1891755.1 dTDP-4-dehydrorhamnose 3,5-epimerase [Verrucomicrobiota bacterium]
MPFEFEKTSPEGLVVVKPVRFHDSRGHFEECFHRKLFHENGIQGDFVQDNQSYSIRHTLRGLHYQIPPCAQAKLVRVIQGKVLDVVVDIRLDSPSYGSHYKIELDAEKGCMLYIPEGFAHGFAVLSDSAIVHYKTTSFYNPHLEAGICWNDPELAIDWNIASPLLSEKDAQLPLLKHLNEDHQTR